MPGVQNGYTLTNRIGISFPGAAQDFARATGRALVQMGFECELSRHTADSSFYLSVNPGFHADGVSISRELAHQIVNEGGGTFSGAPVASLINGNALRERRAASSQGAALRT